ncbi:MAG: addiction module protein [Desulfobulbaceae bacterium]|nr:addiction module protein [Desulfobulbaceae bacterium]
MTMELLWDDLCKNQIDLASPRWHETVLKDREKAIAEGKDKFVDWEDAKKEILNSVS